MASDSFLKIDGIKGESTDAKYKDQIEILSYSHGVSQPTSATASSSGGGSVERCHHQDFAVTKTMDAASASINLACCEGRHIKEVILSLCRAGGDKVEYMNYKMSNVIISSVSVSGGGGGEPVETVTFNYGKIEWTYTPQKRADGTGGGKQVSGWDLQANKKV